MEKKKSTKTFRIPDRVYYWLLILPGTIFVFLFNTRTWPGILAAFQDFIQVGLARNGLDLIILKSSFVSQMHGALSEIRL